MVGRVGLEPTALYPPFKTKQNHIKNRYKFPWTSTIVSTIVSTNMASVHRRKKSRYWYASFTDADGRRVQVSTKQTEKSKALRVALAWKEASDKARQGYLNEAQCQKILNSILGSVTDEVFRTATTRSHLEEWLEGARSDKSHRTYLKYRQVIRTFLEIIGAKSDKPITGITATDIERFKRHREKQKRAPKTILSDLKALNAPFNKAKRQGIISSNPVEAVDRPKQIPFKRDTFTVAQVTLLLEKAPTEDWETVIMLGLYTGARLRDCANMRWDNVNLADKKLSFTASKTRQSMEIPLNKILADYLESLKGFDQPEEYLCPSLAGKDSGGATGLSQSFKQIMVSAGIDPNTKVRDGVRPTSTLSFHSLRHTANSLMANANIPEEVRRRLIGHSDSKTHQIYTHLEQQTLREAIETIPPV